jgi:hypothetical protein
MATGFGEQASGRVDKLEHLFEDRVAKALHRLGMPSLLDIQMLTDRVAQLEAKLEARPEAKPATSARAKPKAPVARKTATPQTPAARPAKPRPKTA